MISSLNRFIACFVDYMIYINIQGNLCSTVGDIFVCRWWHFSCINDIWPREPNFFRFMCECVICSLNNPFSSQQNNVISWVDSVLYNWLDRMWIQSSIYYSDCTWTWFGAHIYRHDTRLLIFWNKDTVIKSFL